MSPVSISPFFHYQNFSWKYNHIIKWRLYFMVFLASRYAHMAKFRPKMMLIEAPCISCYKPSFACILLPVSKLKPGTWDHLELQGMPSLGGHGCCPGLWQDPCGAWYSIGSPSQVVQLLWILTYTSIKWNYFLWPLGKLMIKYTNSTWHNA